MTQQHHSSSIPHAIARFVAALKPLLTHPLFGLGMVLRWVLILTVAPQAPADWYLPFLSASAAHVSLDPWHAFLAAGGIERAFPYGYAMWLPLMSMAFICHWTGLPMQIGYAVTLLILDFALLLLLRRFVVVSERTILALYWCSPIGLFATYWLGLNDIIPITFLCAALLLFRRHKMTAAGAFAGLAISAKASMLVPLPLFFFFLLRNPAYRVLIKPFAIGLGAVLFVFELPYLVSGAALRMLAGNPELAKIYQLTLSTGPGVLIYVLPLAVLLLLFIAWRIRRMSFELLFALIGISFFLVLLLTPAAPGWFVWVLPFLVVYQVQSGRKAFFLVAGFSTFYVLLHALMLPPPQWLGFGAPGQWLSLIGDGLGPRGQALLHTTLFGFGLVLCARLWKESIATNDYFRISRKPLVIGIAGDSGAGKDTLVDSLEELFGAHSVVRLSGDDYHFWDRHKPMWQVMTHLHPRANDLSQFAHDLMALVNGKTIVTRHYDHAIGRKTKPYRQRSNDVIVASGLHALYLPILRDCYDLGIYLDIDESLRRYFKIQRDVHQRGHPTEKVMASIERRASDAERFIHPQAEHADLTLSLRPIHPRLVEEPGTHPMRLKLTVKFRQGLLDESLMRVLIGICGLHVDHSLAGDCARVEMTIEGECSEADIALAARHLIPRLEDLLDIRPRWRDGVAGLMQLLVLAHVHESLRKRLI